MNRNRNMIMTGLATTFALSAFIIASTAQAKPPRSEAQVAQEQALLMQRRWALA